MLLWHFSPVGVSKVFMIDVSDEEYINDINKDTKDDEDTTTHLDFRNRYSLQVDNKAFTHSPKRPNRLSLEIPNGASSPQSTGSAQLYKRNSVFEWPVKSRHSSLEVPSSPGEFVVLPAITIDEPPASEDTVIDQASKMDAGGQSISSCGEVHRYANNNSTRTKRLDSQISDTIAEENANDNVESSQQSNKNQGNVLNHQTQYDQIDDTVQPTKSARRDSAVPQKVQATVHQLHNGADPLHNSTKDGISLPTVIVIPRESASEAKSSASLA